MSFRKTIQSLSLNTINNFQHNKLQKKHGKMIEQNYQKPKNGNKPFCPNAYKSGSFFYIIPEIIFLLIMITFLYQGLKYAA